MNVTKFLTSLLLCLSLIFIPSLRVLGEGEIPVGEKPDLIISEKADFLGCDKDIGAIAEALSGDAGTTYGDWFIFGVASLFPHLDFSEYLAEAYKKIGENAPFTDHLRVGLCALKSGVGISEELNNMISDEGAEPEKMLVSELIFALLLGKVAGWTDSAEMEVFRSELISRQLPDGGFSLMGNRSDTDVSAMALCALWGGEDGGVCEKIIGFLSRVQNADGGYGSMGTPNCESIAQVIIALTSAGIDVKTDQRFLKNGVSPVEALERYRTADGCYSHRIGGKISDMATDQAFLGYISLYLWENDLPELYSAVHFEENEPMEPIPEPVEPSEPVEDEGIEEDIPVDVGEEPSSGVDISIFIFGGGVCLLAVSVFFLVRKKSRFLFFLSLVSLAAVAFPFLDIQTVEEYYAENPEMIAEDSPTVTVAIDCSSVFANMDELDPALREYIPENGFILEETRILLQEGDTVLSILRRACKYRRIHSDVEEARSGAYIRGINYLYERSCGDLSGWMFKVNCEFMSESCSHVELSHGDSVVFVYTCDLGRDVGDIRD